MTTRVLTNSTDTYAAQEQPARAHSAQTFLRVSSGHTAFVYYSIPFPLGATIVSASLELTSQTMTNQPRTIRAAMVNAKQTYTTLNWNNRPGFTGPSSFASSSSGAGGQKWTFDVTAQMQAVADGAFWWGFRINQTAGTEHGGLQFNSRQSAHADRHPKLVVEWADEPDQPIDLAPDGGLAVSRDDPTLRFVYADHGGNTELAGCRVQIAEDPLFTTGVWDSGIQPITIPEFDLSDSTISNYPGLPSNGDTRYWRVMVKDGADLWSVWSDAAAMRYVERGLVTITQPAGDVLMDPTPVVAWTFTGTQSQYQVVVSRGDKIRTPVWDSGRVASTDQILEVPSGILRDDKTYSFTVRLWDDVERASVPGAPAYRQSTRAFWFDEDASTVRPDGASARQVGMGPLVDVEWWGPDNDPDQFMLVRDGLVLGTFTPAEVLIEGTTQRYRFTDRTAPPDVPVRYDVRSVVAGKRSTSRPTVLHHKVVGVWLTTDEETVCVAGDDAGSPILGERSTVHEVGDRVVVITDALRGHEGDWSGEIYSDMTCAPGVSAKEARDALMRIRSNPTGARLHMGPVNIPVILSEVSVRALPNHELAYSVSFNYWQERGDELDAIEENG